MGISLATAKLLKDLSMEMNFRGSALTLGVQDLLFNREDLSFLTSTQSTLKGISHTELFESYGFSQYFSLDVSDYEGADIIRDLNVVNEGNENTFSWIFDVGTLEHVFNIPNALVNIHHLLDVGGCVMHLLPMNNFVDHGFYSFSPTFFWDYYR